MGSATTVPPNRAQLPDLYTRIALASFGAPNVSASILESVPELGTSDGAAKPVRARGG